MKKASKIIRSNRIYPGKGKPIIDGAVIVLSDKIEKIVSKGDDEKWIGPETEVLDFTDRFVMPSFIDAHVHMTYGSIAIDKSVSVDLGHCKSEEECAEVIRDFALKNEGSGWVFGFGWHHLGWSNRALPTKESLDALALNQAICLVGDDFHSVWMNSHAIELCKVIDYEDRYGESVIYSSRGDLTGVLLDNAALYTLDQAIQCANINIKEAYKSFFSYALMNGVTTIGDVAPTGIDAPYRYLKELEEVNQLKVRVKFYSDYDSHVEKVDALMKDYSSPMLRFGGFKVFVDGVISVHTAHMLEPYTDRPDLDGSNQPDYEIIEKQLLGAYDLEVPIRLHVIGDGAVRRSLDFFEKTRDRFGEKPIHNTLEHIEVIHSDDIKRLHDLEVIPSMQPLHGTYDTDEYLKAIGPDRAKKAWAFKSMLNSNCNLAFGTDFPIVGINPMDTLYAAVTRMNENGYPEGGWIPEEKISIQEAIDAYTFGAAYALDAENEIGSLEAGKYADIVVLDRDLFKLDAREILNTKVIMTMMNGEVVYSS